MTKFQYVSRQDLQIINTLATGRNNSGNIILRADSGYNHLEVKVNMGKMNSDERLNSLLQDFIIALNNNKFKVIRVVKK